MTELKTETVQNTETFQNHDIPPTGKANLLKKEVSQDSKNLVLINWIGMLFFAFIPPLVLFLIKKDDEFVLRFNHEMQRFE